MRRIYFTLVLILGAVSNAALAADVDFNFDSKLFQEPAVVENIRAPFSYNSPLYEGLWPTTIEAFRRLDFPVDRPVFTFNIAFNRSVWWRYRG